jgi:hypothetical protein
MCLTDMLEVNLFIVQSGIAVNKIIPKVVQFPKSFRYVFSLIVILAKDPGGLGLSTSKIQSHVTLPNPLRKRNQ